MPNFNDMFLMPKDRAKLEQDEAMRLAQQQLQASGMPTDEMVPVSIPQSMMPEAEALKSVHVASKPKVKAIKKPTKVDDSEDEEEDALPKSVAGPTPIELLLAGNGKEMAAAEDARNMNQLLAVLGKSGSQIGSAISMAPKAADTSGFDALFKAADQPVKDVENRQDSAMKAIKGQSAQEQLKNEIAKEDPKSDISKIGRQILADAAKQAGSPLELPENISLSNMEKLLPGIESMANRRLAAQALAARTADARSDKKEMLDQRIESQTNNQVKSETENYTRNLDQAHRTQDMFKDLRAGKYKSAKNIIGALESDVSALLTGAKQTAVFDRSHAQINALSKTIEEYKSYLSSNPRNLLPEKYLGQLEEEVKTLKGAIIKNYDRKNKELMSGTNNDVKKKLINNRFSTQLNELGYDPATLESKSELADKEPAIQSFMQSNGIKDRNEAIKILKEHGKL